MGCILVFSQNSCWLKSLKLLSGKDNFTFQPENNRAVKEVEIIIVDLSHQSFNEIIKKLSDYNGVPVFIYNPKKRKYKKLKGLNIIGEITTEASVHHLVQQVRLCLGHLISNGYPDKGLNTRERIILKCLVKGLSNKEIARLNSIGPATVKYYLQRLYQKLGVRNRVEAALTAGQMAL